MAAEHESRVVVTDVHMPFLSMVVFMVKWAIASIPAVIILAVIWSLVMALFGSVSGGFMAGGGYFGHGHF
ncbi:MAG: hypothetical protein P8180_05660 [Gammaproteobacteria bacterium]|jgi:hypothetical protein